MNSAVKTRLQTLLDRAPLRQLRSAIALLERWITPAFDLAIRLYVASVFLRSGWLKISDWGTTRLLFANEYHVPFLPPDVAAVMGAGGRSTGILRSSSAAGKSSRPRRPKYSRKAEVVA